MTCKKVILREWEQILLLDLRVISENPVRAKARPSIDSEWDTYWYSLRMSFRQRSSADKEKANQAAGSVDNVWGFFFFFLARRGL